MSSGSFVVSENEGEAPLQKPVEMSCRRRKQQSPFKVPDSSSLLLMSVNDKEHKKEEMHKFLALPIGEKTTLAARLKNELVGDWKKDGGQNQNDKMKNVKDVKSKTVLPKQASERHELRIPNIKREKIRDKKDDLISMERQKAVIELSLMTKRSEIMKMNKAIAKEERQLKQLENSIERDNLRFEEFLKENEKKSVEAKTHYEEEAKVKQRMNTEIKRLSAEIVNTESEVAKLEETLKDYKRYKELLFKLSPPEWQYAQRVKGLKGKVPSHSDKQEEQMNLENGTEGGHTGLSSPQSNILDTSPKLECDNSEYEDEPELYFTDPQQLLDLMGDLTEQNLSLIQNSSRVEETLEELQQSIEINKRKIEKDEEQIELQIKDMKQRIDKEKVRGVKLEQKVKLHVSLNAEDQDVMLEVLSEKVAEVHRSCVSDRMVNLSTLEKLASIESYMSTLMQGLENIPEDKLEMMKRIKDSERRSREREEKLRAQKEKQQDRMRRYMERALADSKKISGRKLMPRCMPVTPKVKVSNVSNLPAEEDIHEYLFCSEETE
ncbi:cilia- and flagella-associated protein 100 [Gouania willdenowi]|uniref:cilia- and flagella-associated protein 100 n=1 Tax=Gouania willdenowi TaxID=441366 RepID=UPI00105524FE|nr:cilia- and flagella-associated protein 100-like [Gouania willdenowi]